jgi:hypothetical protein
VRASAQAPQITGTVPIQGRSNTILTDTQVFSPLFAEAVLTERVKKFGLTCIHVTREILVVFAIHNAREVILRLTHCDGRFACPSDGQQQELSV